VPPNVNWKDLSHAYYLLIIVVEGVYRNNKERRVTIHPPRLVRPPSPQRGEGVRG